MEILNDCLCESNVLGYKAVMSMDTYYKVVIPTLELMKKLEQETLIRTSTPQDSFNFNESLMKLEDPETNLPLFKTLESVELEKKNYRKK